MSRHGTGAAVKIRLYLEGRLIDDALAHVTVSGSIGAPASAQLELVPTNSIKHILPGTWVHIFTTDPWDASPAGDLSDYKLLFEGVVISRGFSRQDGGRNFTVQCADPSVYWVEARQFWLNVTSAGGNIVDQLVTADSGGFARLGTVNSTGSYGYMSQRLGSNKDQPEERFMDTMISAIDDIGNVNPFYTNARNRFRLTDRIIRGPAGATSKLFELAMMSDFLDGLAGRTGGQTSLVEMVNQLLSSIMHEWVSVPAPPYLKTRIFMRDVFGNIKRNKKTVKRNVKGVHKVDLFEYETATDSVVGSVIFKPHIYSLSPPTCNVLFPNMYDQMSYQENFLQETTRLQMQPQMPMVSAQVLQGVRFIRPTELEVFQALVRDPKRKSIKKRTPDGKFADGNGQTPTFSDYDWSTNEERIRGIVYEFINMAPAPSTLTLTDPGKKTPTGARKGGVPKYLQNVASYEYYKSKYVARQTSLTGPYNIRPVPGFSILALDDSAANMNIIAYLEGVQHSIDATGTAITTYTISHPRLTDEIDLNRPIFKGSKLGEKLDFDLVKEGGRYDFSKVFEGGNQPPIPEWFDETYRTLEGLDNRYAEWFGASVGVVERILFKEPSEQEKAAIKAQDEAIAAALKAKTTAKHKATVEDLPAALRDRIIPANDAIQIHAAAAELNAMFGRARDTGHEMDVASEQTKRTFTTIDQAFKFVGASPREYTDKVYDNGVLQDAATGSNPVTFVGSPAESRVIDYKTARLDRFVGDVSAGSGYSGAVEGVASELPDAVSGADAAAVGTTPAPLPAQNKMSGAFPVFDTKIHTGKEATDPKTREALIKSGTETASSDFARYDGRPLMFDFEFRLWQESLKAAGYGPNANEADKPPPGTNADWFSVEGGATRPATPEEQATAAEKRLLAVEKKKKEDEARTAKGRHRPTVCKTMAPKDQAPTGDGLEQNERKPLTQPLSEKQVIDLRRAIIDAYRDELAGTRGFTG